MAAKTPWFKEKINTVLEPEELAKVVGYMQIFLKILMISEYRETSLLGK